MENDYKQYPVGTRVRIKSSRKEGEAYESVWHFISVFIDGEDKAKNFFLDEVEFLNDNSVPKAITP
jgi:hypothetical protein